MATHQFKFAVSDVDLSDEQIEEIGQAIARAGSAALSKYTPNDAIEIRIDANWWWRGVPPDDIHRALEEFAHKQIGG